MAAMKARKGHKGVGKSTTNVKSHAPGHKMVKGADTGPVKQSGKGVQESGEKKHKMKKGAKVTRPK